MKRINSNLIAVLLPICLLVANAGSQVKEASPALALGKAACRNKQWDIAEKELLASYNSAHSSMAAYLLAMTYKNLNNIDKMVIYSTLALNLPPPLPSKCREYAQYWKGWAEGAQQGRTVHETGTVAMTVDLSGPRDLNAEIYKAQNYLPDPCFMGDEEACKFSDPESATLPDPPDVLTSLHAVSGTVRTQSQQALSGVNVYFDDESKPIETDSDGAFWVAAAQDHLLFLHPGFLPVVRTLSPDLSEVDIDLEQTRDPSWNLRSCDASKPPKFLKNRDGFVQFPAKSGATTKRSVSRYPSLATYAVRYSSGGHDERLDVVYNTDNMQDRPPLAWFATSEELSGRAWKAGDSEGIDVRGRAPSAGKHSRWTGYSHAYARYQDASESAARFFDDIIDGMCFKPGAEVPTTLELFSDPVGAEIELDGTSSGHTPATLTVLPGEHTIKFSKPGYQSWEDTRKTTSGKVEIIGGLQPQKQSIVAQPSLTQAPGTQAPQQ